MLIINDKFLLYTYLRKKVRNKALVYKLRFTQYDIVRLNFSSILMLKIEVNSRLPI